MPPPAGTAQPDASAPSSAAGMGPASEIAATLPEPDELLPQAVVTATAWLPMPGAPAGFDPSETYASANDLAEAFGAAIAASFGGLGGQRPELSLDVLEETDAGAVLLVTETGAGDDSVAGSQYALLAVAEPAGWVLEGAWARALCRRGGSDETCT